jgi:NADPH-dependent 2,4-dienoyl-CoA reductase/sulfur reductase-like enzyme
VFDGRTVALASTETSRSVEAKTLILAPGAYDRPVPFPGWTLPGVVTAGGAQNLMRGYGVLPGRRVLVAGSGPLLLRLAHDLIRDGARVEALCDASGPWNLWRHGLRLLPHLNVVQKGCVGDALRVVRAGGTDPNEIKARTRIGMGRCQGRMCGPALAHLLARNTGRPVGECGMFTARPPAPPVPLGALADGGAC